MARFWIIFGPVFDDFWVAFFNDFAPFCGPALTPLPTFLGSPGPILVHAHGHGYMKSTRNPKSTHKNHKRDSLNGELRRSVLQLSVANRIIDMAASPQNFAILMHLRKIETIFQKSGVAV